MPTKPFGGFPSRKAYARQRYADGAQPADIAEEMGIGRGAVYNYIADKRDGTVRRQQVSEINEAFVPAAERRRMTVDTLKRKILLTIAREPVLIDNILDDGAGE
ncbi:hypothetical protein [Oceaniradius stylonematis]|uniref:hypothetical protein n=1 Tax=Oceaniradius stylonematis TaxID=2184161 RepID=UPI00273DC8F9|nr:hypothetical protein [Oceaniradius stylonematis]